jgi:hypothetical protein
LLTNLGAYENPFIDDVVNTTLADFDASAGATRAAQDLDIARSGAFGGSGSALTKSLTEGELARGRASTDANLRFTAKDKAFGYSGQDADRRQSASMSNAANELAARNQKLAAAGMLTDISSGFDANQRANYGAMADIGSQIRGILDARAQSPITLLQTELGLFNDLNPELYFGENEKGTETQKGKSSGFSFGVSAGKK